MPMGILIGIFIALVIIIFLLYLFQRFAVYYQQQQVDQFLRFEEPPVITEVYREELKDSFVDVALWRCTICHFRNHPERRLCDLCQTPRSSLETSKRLRASRSTMDRIGETEAYLPRSSQRYLSNHKSRKQEGFSKLQLAASRRQQWKRMPTNDGLHRWVRQRSNSSNLHHQIPQSNDSKRVKHLPRPSLSDSMDSDREETNNRDSMASIRSNISVGYIRVRDSMGHLVLNSSDVVATDFHYRINIVDPSSANNAPSELIMNLEGVHNLPFTDKIRWFSTEIHRLWLPWESGHAELVIRRDHILQDSFHAVKDMKPYQLRQRWRVMFAGEPALDAGGVMREWFTLLFAELFDVNFGLFVSTVGDESGSYWINTYSQDYHENDRELFEFAGRLIGKAILEEHLVPVHLALPFLKHILGVPISFSDLQFLDDEIYNSAQLIKRTKDLEVLALDFTVTRLGPNDSQPTVYELVENGADIDVTIANRKVYLDALFKYHVLNSVSAQLLSFLTALYDVVPEGLLKLFDYQELELLMCGVPSIDVEDWKKHTDFRFFTAHIQTDLELQNIGWFWDIVGNRMTNGDRVRLLQFATGTSRVPAQGFKGLISSDGRVRRFNIAFTGFNQSCLFPKAHTCFNRLDLPIYNTREEMREYLFLIVQMDITGFTIE